MVRIKFIAQGSNSLIGGFSSGDLANVSPAFARHLVEDARVAVYAEHPQPEQPKRTRKPRATNADE